MLAKVLGWIIMALRPGHDIRCPRGKLPHQKKDRLFWCRTITFHITVQYLHSYEQKSNKNRLRRWDFCVQSSGFWHIHAKTPRGTVAPEQLPHFKRGIHMLQTVMQQNWRAMHRSSASRRRPRLSVRLRMASQRMNTAILR